MKRAVVQALLEMGKLDYYAHKKGMAYQTPIRIGRYPKGAKVTENVTLRLVSLNKVITKQPQVFHKELVGHITKTRLTCLREKLPVVFYHEGFYYVLNGNHRITAKMLKGRTKMKMRVCT